MDEDDNDTKDLRPLDPAIEATLTQHHRDFLRFLARRVGSSADAEDILQDFYLRAVDKAYSLRSSESVLAWLYRVLRSTLADHFRRAVVQRRRQREYVDDQRDIAAASINSDEEFQADICMCLYKLLPALKPEYADVIWRADLIGRPRAEIAVVLAISQNNLAVRLHRARMALRRALLQSCTTCPTHGFDRCECGLPLRSEIVSD